MNQIYKLQFETVSPLGKGSQFYDGDNPRLPPEFVPDEFWTSAERETDDPWDQYTTLKAWAASGAQLIRNVRLFRLVSQPEWVLVHENEKPNPDVE